MEELGEKLKEAREKMGVKISEVAEDIKIRETLIENIEEGDIKAFKDMFFLKHAIKEYGKYLGLDSEKLIDELNEFLFDYTSKIPVEDIQKAKEEIKQEKEISSPYTIEEKQLKKGVHKTLYIIAGVILLIVAAVLIYSNISEKNNETSTYWEGDIS